MRDTVRLLAMMTLAIGLLSPATQAAATYGLTGIRPHWESAAPEDAIGVRFRFFVADNESTALKIVFSDSRLCGAQPDTYLVEYNIYDEGLRYVDWTYTKWPMLGTRMSQEASLRVAIPDYVREGRTGARTSSPEMFPRQTYEIDGVNGLWKTDLVSQTNLNKTECAVEMTRAGIVSDLSGWRVDDSDLPAGAYRQWNVRVEFDRREYGMSFVVPDMNGEELCTWESLIFFTEFLHGMGLLRVYLWDFAVKKEGSDEWQPIDTWSVSHHDGSLEAFGVCKSEHRGIPVIEISNDPARSYLPVDSVIDLTHDSQGCSVLFDESHNVLWTNSTSSGWSQFADMVRQMGCTVSVLDASQALSSRLGQVDLLIVGWSSRSYSPSELSCIESFVRGGGALLVMGESWSWNELRAFPLNQIGGVFGMTIEGAVADDPVRIRPHDVTNGVSVIQVAASSAIIHSVGTALATDPVGRALLVACSHGAGRVLFAGDSDIFTDIDYDGDGIPMLREGDNWQLAWNTIDWLTSR